MTNGSLNMAKPVVNESKDKSLLDDDVPVDLPTVKISTPIKIVRKQGEAGEFEDRVTGDFIKIMDLMEGQRADKISNMAFREAYRRKTVQPARAHSYSRTTFI